MRRFTGHLLLKAISLLLAAFLWLEIVGGKTSEVGLTVPVALQNIPKDIELVGDSVNEVELRLRASPSIVQALDAGSVRAEVDLSAVEPGERLIHLTPDAVTTPFGVEVVKIQPSQLTLTFERTLQKVIPVHPRVSGVPGTGYEVESVRGVPGDIRIAGPRSRVLRVEHAFTEPVQIEGAVFSVSGDVGIGIDDPLLRIQAEPRARVTVQIREEHAQRRLESLEIEQRGGQARLATSQVSVMIDGPARIVENFDASGIQPYVDLQAPTPEGDYRVAVELAPGNRGIAIVAVEPERVEANLTTGKN